MVLPLIATAGAVGGHLARFGVTSASLRTAGGTFAQSLPFGAGYSFGTYIGFPKNYQGSYSNTNKPHTYSFNYMPYGNYRSSFGQRNYSRYRYGRNRYTNYRRTPSYGRRRPYYRRSYRRSYY